MVEELLWLFFFSSRRRHTRFDCDWSSDVCSSDLTVKSPVSEAQVMVNDVDAVPPAETVTVRDVPLFTEQLLGTLLRTTVWLAGERLENVTLSVGPIDWLVLPSRVTV